MKNILAGIATLLFIALVVTLIVVAVEEQQKEPRCYRMLCGEDIYEVVLPFLPRLEDPVGTIYLCESGNKVTIPPSACIEIEIPCSECDGK